jgi:hypothetical protein
MHGFKIAALAALVLAFAAAPAGATGIPTTGTPITLGNCVASPCASTYPAGEPFFVRHGFITDGTEADLRFLLDPQTRFELTVDGQLAPSALELDLDGDPPSKRYITNFRFGMTGVHTFVGCWYSEGALVYCGTRTITFTG